MLPDQLEMYRAEFDRNAARWDVMDAQFLATQLKGELDGLGQIRSVDQINMTGTMDQVVDMICFTSAGNARGKLANKIGIPNRVDEWWEWLVSNEVGESFSSLDPIDVGNEISTLNLYAVQWIGHLLIPKSLIRDYFRPKLMNWSLASRNSKKLGLPSTRGVTRRLKHYTDGELAKEHNNFAELIFTTGWLFTDALDDGSASEHDRDYVAWFGRRTFGTWLFALVRAYGATISHHFQGLE